MPKNLIFSDKTLLDWVRPPPFGKKNLSFFLLRKFWIWRDPPPLLSENLREKKKQFLLCRLALLRWLKLFWVVSRPGPQTSTSRALTWIQCKLGKQYLVKKCTLPWESNPGPTPIRGDTATLIASVGLKKNSTSYI